MRRPDLFIRKLNLATPPLETYRRLREDFDISFILESAIGTARTVAYSFLGFGPSATISCRNGRVEGGLGPDHLAEDPVRYLSELVGAMEVPSQRFPFMGGLVGYFSYEFARRSEPASVPEFPEEFPEFELGLYRELIIYDHSRFQAYHISLGENHEILEALGSMEEPPGSDFHAGELRGSMNRERFEEGVRSVQARVKGGEVFQTVISRRLSCPYRGDLLNLYSSLRELNPSPYMFYLDFGDRTILGSSPETLLTIRGGEATTYPIAGTCPLGSGAAERKRLREGLLRDEKERAEHTMLVDLARNDLARVCEGGSIGVPEFMRVEEFSHVQHLVSKVQGTLSPGCSAVEALASVFPAGTVSGAPKPRSLEIIGEVEGVSRGPYAGAVGYLGLNGNLDTAITIRSAFACDGMLHMQAGSGIVADSVPSKEYEETEQKLEAMRAALARAMEETA